MTGTSRVRRQNRGTRFRSLDPAVTDHLGLRDPGSARSPRTPGPAAEHTCRPGRPRRAANSGRPFGHAVRRQTNMGTAVEPGSIRAMTHITPESVHLSNGLDLPGISNRGSMARTPARPGAVWWRSVAPPELGSVREVRALTHGAPRRQPVVGLRPPPPEANAEAIEPRHAVHVGSRMIARRAGGTPRVPPAPLQALCASHVLLGVSVRVWDRGERQTARDPGGPCRNHRAVP